MPGGRPSKRPQAQEKLEYAFSRGLNATEACLYAGIDQKTYYNWRKKDPEFVQKIDTLRENLKMHAKMNISDAIINDGSVQDSWKLLEKVDEDLVPRTKSELTVKETVTDEYDEQETSNIIRLVQSGTADTT